MSAVFISPREYKKKMEKYFAEVVDVYSRHGFQGYKSEESRRFKAYYNMTKSALLLQMLDPKSKVLDLGCGNGTEILKYIVHKPNAVVLVDIKSVENALGFAVEKKVNYDIAAFTANIATDKLHGRRVQCSNAAMGCIPRWLVVDAFNLATTFCVLEYIPSIGHLQHVVSQIHACLRPGGVWVGCMINTTKLLQRVQGGKHYQDTYSQFKLVDSEWYEMTVNGCTMKQSLAVSPFSLQRAARDAGFEQLHSSSLPTYLEDLPRTKPFTELAQNMQLNNRFRLKIPDLYALSMLHVFVFRRL